MTFSSRTRHRCSYIWLSILKGIGRIFLFSGKKDTNKQTKTGCRRKPNVILKIVWRKLCIAVKPDGFLLGTLQTSVWTLVFDWQFESTKLQSARASCNRIRKYHLKSGLQNEILIVAYDDMGNIHYNRTTTLEKRQKIIALWTSGQFKTGTNQQTKMDYCVKRVDLPFRLVFMEK